MIELAVRPPTIPIPFQKLLKVVAIVDPEAPQIGQLLDHLAAEHFEVEIAPDFNRDVSEDAGVGADLASIDGDCLERARQLVHAVRAIGFRMPLWGLADSHQIADIAVLGTTGEVDGLRKLRGRLRDGRSIYAKSFVAPDEDTLTFFRRNTLPE